jgi:hypothetical protein
MNTHGASVANRYQTDAGAVRLPVSVRATAHHWCPLCQQNVRHHVEAWGWQRELRVTCPTCHADL